MDPLLRTVAVPAGVYRSGKARSRHADVAASPAPSALPTPTASPGAPSRAGSPLHLHNGTHAAGSTGVNGAHAHAHAHTHRSGVVLPSLHAAIASTPLGFELGGPHYRAVPRIAEDQRMIQMLNARPI